MVDLRQFHCCETEHRIPFWEIQVERFVPYSLVRFMYEKCSKIDHLLTARLIIQCRKYGTHKLALIPNIYKKNIQLCTKRQFRFCWLQCVV